MKRRIYRYENFAFFDRSAIEAHLARMAEKGLMLDHIGTVLWRYRRTEPKKLRFSAVYFPDCSEYDPEMSESAQSRIEFCEHDGWKLCAQWREMLIFCSENADAVPIETDAVMQLSVIERTMRKSFFPQQVLLLLLGLSQCIIQLGSLLSAPLTFYTNALSVAVLPFWLIFTPTALLDVLRSLLWLRRARSLAEQDELPEFRPWRIVRVLQFAALGILLVLGAFSAQWRRILLPIIAFVFVIIAVSTGLKNLLRRKGVSASANRTINAFAVFVLTLLLLLFSTLMILLGFHRSDAVGQYQTHGISYDVYADELPIALEELYEIPAEMQWSRQTEINRSLLALGADCRQWPLTDDPDAPELAYRLYCARFPFILDTFEQTLLDESAGSVVLDGKTMYPQYEEIPAAPWGAVRAYRRSDFDSRDHLLLRYEKTILSIALPEPADDALAARLAAALEVLPERLSF